MELAIIGGLAATSLYYRFTIEYRKKRKIINAWNDLMEEVQINNSNRYKMDKKYISEIEDIEFIKNGYILIVGITTGNRYKDLENLKEAIENKFECVAIIEKVRFSNKAKIKIITKDIDMFMYAPVNTEEHQLYIGKTLDSEDFFINIAKFGHLLIGGATGTGKTFLLSSILTNLIYNSSNYIEVHLSQIMKGEIGLFKNCNCVKFVGENLKEVASDLERVAKIVDDRSKKFTNLGVKNLEHYNKYFSSRLKRIYYVIEELSFFMPTEGDIDEDVFYKSKCWNSILTIVKAGRSSGVHFLSVTQRSTTTNLPSDVKSQLCRITFRQISSIDSKNIIECDLATELDNRECLCYGTGRIMEPIKTPWIDEDFKELNKYVKEIIIPKEVKEYKGIRTIIVNEGVPRELPLVENKSEIVEKDIEDIFKVKSEKIVRKVKKGMIKIEST